MFVLSENLQQVKALDKLEFKDLLAANCSDFEDPVGANKGLFWRYTLPFAFEKFVMAAVKAFLTLEVPQRYMCNFEGKNSQLVPADIGVVYTQKILGQQLVLQANSLQIGDRKYRCHWSDGIKLNNRSWEYTRSETAWAFAKLQKGSTNLLFVDFIPSTLTDAAVSKFRIDGRILHQVSLEDPCCDMKFVSSGKCSSLLMLSNNCTGYLRELVVPGSDAQLTIVSGGAVHLSKVVFSEEAEGFSQALKRLVLRLVDKSNQDHKTLFKDPQEPELEGEDVESEEFDGQEEPHEKQKLQIELETTQYAFSKKVVLEGLDVDRQRRVFVYGKKIDLTQEQDQSEESIDEVEAPEDYPDYDLYDVFILAFDSNPKSLALQNGFWITSDPKRTFFRCERSFREWRLEGVDEKDVKYRRERWGKLSRISCITNFPNVSLLLIMKNFEFTVVGYTHKSKQFYSVKPPSAIFEDIRRLPTDHEVFFESSTQTVSLLQLPPRSHRSQNKWTRSWQSGPLFVLEQYRLHI